MPTSINLHGATKDSFGSRMPNVFINRVSIDYSEEEYGISEFKIHLSIKFSKPDYIQGMTVHDFIRKSFKDLRLYTYLTYKDWIPKYLEENRFPIEYWIKRSAPDADPVYQENRYLEIPLLEFTREENIYSSELTTGSTFDEAGNELIEISNIILTMTYYGEDLETIPKLTDVENLMVLSFIGIKKEAVFEERYSEGYSETMSRANPRDYRKLTNNAYFSDISYYHILDKNRIATKFYEAYATPDGMPYHNSVLQATNGKVYATDNYSFDNIKQTIESMIDDYSDDRASDSVLDSNIGALEAIVNAVENKSGVPGELSNYRAFYPDKSPTRLSGQFYLKFVTVLAEIMETIQLQTELSTVLLYDSMVVDKRFALMVGTYTRPHPSGLFGIAPNDGTKFEDVIKGIPYEEPSDCYIPKKWVLNARKAILTDSISSLSDEAIRELYNTTASEAVGGLIEGFKHATIGWHESDRYQTLLDELQSSYEAAGLSPQEALQEAKEELAYFFSTGEQDSEYTGAMVVGGTSASELLNPTLNGGSYLELRAGDAIVMNKGVFFFEYEKALRTQSKISHIFDLSKLQLLFRISVPYQDFYVKKVELSRNETRLTVDSEDYEFEKYVRTKMQLNLCTPSFYDSEAGGTDEIDYPKNKTIDFKYFGGPGEEFGATLAVYAEKLKYMHPFVHLGGVKYNSQLKFVNFDLPLTDPIRKLGSFNNMDSAGTSGPASLTQEKVLDGYRLMAFRYKDFMDDDVALYNTQEVEDDRGNLIEDSNSLAERVTCYSMTVEVVDQTHVTYDKFADYLMDSFNEFEEFYKKAADICSFNNIKNEFNAFFIDAVTELYPVKVWIKSAYIAEALSELLFTGPSSSIDFDLFEERVLETVVKISPETGNLFQLTAFAKNFKRLVRYIIPDLGDSDPDTAVPIGTMTPWLALHDSFFGSGARTIQFYNEKPIWEPISGDITPDDLEIDAFETRLVPSFARKLVGVEPVSEPWTDGILDADPMSMPTNELVTGYAESREAKAAFELIFYPFDIGEDDTTWATHYYMGPPWAWSTPEEGSPWWVSAINWNHDELLATDINENLKNLVWLDSYFASYATYFIDRLFRYSTVDVAVTNDGSASRGYLQPGSELVPGTPFNRDKRTVGAALHLLAQIVAYAAEAYYQPDNLDNVFWSKQIESHPGRPNTNSGNSYIYRKIYYYGYDTAKKLLNILSKAYIDEIETGTGHRTWTLYAELESVFNEDNPWGPDIIGDRENPVRVMDIATAGAVYDEIDFGGG